MRSPKFRKVTPNYKRRVLEIILSEKGKNRKYSLPFSALETPRIGKENLFTSLEIDDSLGAQAISYRLQDGTKGNFPADFVLYHCDPTYDWSPINQLKKTLKGKLECSQLSLRVMADALSTSPSQVVRLLEGNYASKQLLQLFQLAELAGYQVEFQLKKKTNRVA